MDNISYKIFSLETMALDSSAAEEYADYLEDKGLLKAPSNLKSSILERSRHLDVQLVAGTNQLSKKTQLFFYGLKVGFAVACSIVAVAAAPGLPAGHFKLQTDTDMAVHMELYEKFQEWNGKINNLSKTLLNLEVTFYD